ncbi:recombinase family protein [Streptomyces mesophilus]|uniref:recombinase family protein n=1 Tax=Streptomyces mesophilus TaxID=1775132 RepID=UPI00332DF5A4
MIDTRDPARRGRTYSRSYVAPELQGHLDAGGALDVWLDGRMPIASIARISADRLRGDAVGIARQHRNNTRNAALHSCAVVVHYEDNHVSAARPDVVRPAFRQMVRDIIHGRVAETDIPLKGCIAVERERVFRLSGDGLLLLDALAMGGGVFIEDGTRVDLAEIRAELAGATTTLPAGDAEVGKMRARTKRSAADRAEEGGAYGSPRRFGWLGASQDPPRVGNQRKRDDEWPHLIAMIKARSAGRSWRSITADINKAGARTARGNRFTEQAVKAMVTNPAWWGGRVLAGELVVDAATGAPVIGEWDHATEAGDGVGYETWKAVMAGVRANRLLRGMAGDVRSRPPAGPRTRSYLFSGVLRCGRINDFDEVCHAKLSGNKASGRNEKYGDYYRCGDANCKGIGRQVAAVDTYLEGLVLDWLDVHFSGTEVQLSSWRGEQRLCTLRAQLRGIDTSLLRGEVDRADVGDLVALLRRRIAMLVEEEAEHLAAQRRRNLLLGWTRGKWEGLEFDEKRDVVGQVLSSVVVMPIPAGVSDKAPFNPGLLKVTWRQDTRAR